MLISYLLAQVIGVYLVFVGLVLILRYNELRHIIIEVFNNRALIFVGGIFTLLIGLVIVLSHNIWETNWVVLITIAGWFTLLKGLAYLFLPQSTLAKLAQFLNKPGFYIAGGVASLVVGGFLAFQGFGAL